MLLLDSYCGPGLDGLGDMIGGDHVAFGEVGYGACQFEDAVIGTGGEVELLHGGFEQFFAGGVGLAEVAHFGWPHFGVAGGGCAFETVELAGTGRLHTLADGFGFLDIAFIGQLLVIDARNLNMDVDAI